MARPVCPNPKCAAPMPESADDVYMHITNAGQCRLVYCRRCGTTLGVVPHEKS